METTIKLAEFKPDKRMGAAIYNIAVQQPEVGQKMMSIANSKVASMNAIMAGASSGRLTHVFRATMRSVPRAKKLVSISLSNGNYAANQRAGVEKLAARSGVLHW